MLNCSKTLLSVYFIINDVTCFHFSFSFKEHQFYDCSSLFPVFHYGFHGRHPCFVLLVDFSGITCNVHLTGLMYYVCIKSLISIYSLMYILWYVFLKNSYTIATPILLEFSFLLRSAFFEIFLIIKNPSSSFTLIC